MKVEPNFRSPPLHSDESDSWASDPQIDEATTKEAYSSSTTVGPPTSDLNIKLKKRCFMLAGSSPVGVSMVTVQGWVGSLRNDQTDLRLDSCHPACQKRLKIDLWQLSNKDTKFKAMSRSLFSWNPQKE